MKRKQKITVAVAGNPNSGKTTIFNLITGSAQKVGNWPGVTVERVEGERKYGNHILRFVDLPGTYSLSAFSPEEKVARDFLLYEYPDVVLVVVDASHLERNLYLVA
ncbi:50S ribosome-binding GTPase, partial [bacterium]|nr:50S ribosome-binding GTPase [bacterium]